MSVSGNPQGSKTGNPEYEEIKDWVPSNSQGSKSSGSPSKKASGRDVGGPPALEGAELSDSSDNGDGDDYVDMKSFMPPKQSSTLPRTMGRNCKCQS